MSAPSMVHRLGDSLIVRSVVSGDRLYSTGSDIEEDEQDFVVGDVGEEDVVGNNGCIANTNITDDTDELPQCKVKRNYACSSCDYYTQNPRFYLHHLKNVHKEKIKIYECPNCLYASKHSQKLQRHIHMVHVMGKTRLLIKSQSIKKSIKEPKPPPIEEPPPGMDDDTTQPEEEEEDDGQSTAMETETDDNTATTTTTTNNDEDKEYLCSLCSFKSHNQSLVTRHERIVHLKKKFFRCTKCAYITHMKARFTKHVKYHSMPMIKCNMCDFKTPYKWNLDRHYKSHGAEGAFRCSQCNFTAEIKQSLTVHEMNHHIPPINQAGHVGPVKRRCKVGASDTISQEQQQFNNEEQSSTSPNQSPKMPAVEISVIKSTDNVGSSTYAKMPRSSAAAAAAYMNGGLNADDVIFAKNGSVYVKRFKCRVCQYKAAWESEMIRHEMRVHRLDVSSSKKKPRPIPDLIRIQNNNSPSPSNSSEFSGSGTTALDDFDYPKNSNTSSLQDFASLIEGNEDLQKFYNNQDEEKLKPDSFKKKNATFFDRLKEKLVVGVGGENLTCGLCGHNSKCLSESVLHQKQHAECNMPDKEEKAVSATSPSPSSSSSYPFMDSSSSNRCRYCRQRCKTSADLYLHLQTCTEIGKNDDREENESEEGEGEGEGEEEYDDEELTVTAALEPNVQIEEGDELDEDDTNRIFVWNNNNNNFTSSGSDGDGSNASNGTNGTNGSNGSMQMNEHEDDDRSKSPCSETSLVGFEVAPGFGSIASKESLEYHMKYPLAAASQENNDNPEQGGVPKKVYKCVDCSFWATTASRFHVHIVGHLNKKPFECSACCYRSNWRWDITKHIRLKKIRDSCHEKAKVLMTDETGRRNYSKYNKFLTVMKIMEPCTENSVSCKRKIDHVNTEMMNGSGSNNEDDAAAAAADGGGGGYNNVKHPRLSSPDTTQSFVQTASSSSCNSQTPLQLKINQNNLKMKKSNNNESKSNSEGRKTMWKCKKCSFRAADRAVVLSHVKDHYQPIKTTASSCVNDYDNNESASTFNHHLSSSSLLSSTTSNLQYANNFETFGQLADMLTDNQMNLPFIGENGMDNNGLDVDEEEQRRQSEQTHNQQPEADTSFKCCYCPFYSNRKLEVMDHVMEHGVKNPEVFISSGKESTLTGEYGNNITNVTTSSPPHNTIDQDESINGEMNRCKRFQCPYCPYLTNNKSQYTYHRQFHEHRVGSYKCDVCSYTVTKRHLLHQHARIHQKEEDSVKEEYGNIAKRDELDTRHMTEIPLVWVYRSGQLVKMFKCRQCPHVNVRKCNIVEHEKMHSKPIQSNSSQCVDCNYICISPGALASHYKVHQGIFGQICALVDFTKSDEMQVNEIMSCIKMEEEPLKVNSVLEQEVTITAIPERRTLNFCPHCPARFVILKDLEIHRNFHKVSLQYKCGLCSYTAGREAHLVVHSKVHCAEYQEKTNVLLQTLQMSHEYPRPNVKFTNDLIHTDEKGWTVMMKEEKATKVSVKQFPCTKCPAHFFKAAARDYHLTLHGCAAEYKCRSCDYAVKNYGNLIKHEAVHQLPPREKLGKRNKEESVTKTDVKTPSIDPEFGVLMHGSTEFVYPMTCKNGKMKEKRYKCHKCPSAFDKRDQYKIHLALHGSNQRYKCEKCDYSVKYYANYTQHMRKHDVNETSILEIRGNEMKMEAEDDDDDDDDGSPPASVLTPEVSVTEDEVPNQQHPGKSLKLSTADLQAIMLMQQRAGAASSSSCELLHRCPYCPYRHIRKDVVDSHVKCHAKNKINAFVCDYCEYTVPQKHLLREHKKIHFQPIKGVKPEGYMLCDKLELVTRSPTYDLDRQQILIFKDAGEEVMDNDRFSPKSEEAEPTIKKICVNIKTGDETVEETGGLANGLNEKEVKEKKDNEDNESDSASTGSRSGSSSSSLGSSSTSSSTSGSSSSSSSNTNESSSTKDSKMD